MPSADRVDGSDPVEALQESMPTVQALPVADRVERFEAANRVLAAALAELDEV